MLCQDVMSTVCSTNNDQEQHCGKSRIHIETIQYDDTEVVVTRHHKENTNINHNQ